MNSDIGVGFIIGNTVAKIKKIRSQMRINKENKDFEANKELQIELNKKITRAIYLLRAKLVGDKFEKGKTSYRFNDKHFKEIHMALNNLCYKSYKHETECLESFIDSIKNAVINVRDE